MVKANKKKKLLWVKKIILIWIVWWFSTQIVSLVADKVLNYSPSFPYADAILAKSKLPQWIYSWANFDGVHYLTIADRGYEAADLIQAFFPLFPLVVKGFNYIINNSLVSGLIIVNLCSLLMLLAFSKLLSLDYKFKDIKWIMIVYLSFCTSFFFRSFYNESLFMVFVFFSLFFARKQKYLLAGIIAALATATRVIGIFLLPTLLIELLYQMYIANKKKIQLKDLKSKAFLKNITYISISSLGLLLYMVYLEKNYNDYLYFFHVQQEFGAGRQESLISLPQVIWRYIKMLATYKPINLKYYAIVQEFLTSILGIFALIFSFKKVRLSYWTFGLLCFILPTLTGTFSSMPRYILVCFALFIATSNLIKQNKIAKLLWFTIMPLLQILNLVLFFQGYWVA